MTSVTETTNPPVRKTINVNTSVAHAFHVFTEGFDTWWPRSHSIGGAALQKAVIETRSGGRCYQQSVDGSECDWGRILVWEPPRRFVIAWQLNPQWEYESDLSKAVRSKSASPRSRMGRRASISSIATSIATAPAPRCCARVSIRRKAGAACCRCTRPSRLRHAHPEPCDSR